MRFPRVTATGVLLSLLAMLMLASVANTRESLLFCEKALFGETKILEKETAMKAPIKFTDICPEVRQRAENNLNRWLELLLALAINLNPHPPNSP